MRGQSRPNGLRRRLSEGGMITAGNPPLHTLTVLPFPGSPRRRASLSRALLGLEKKGKHVTLMNPKREARLCGGPGAAPKREARVPGDPRKGSTSPGSGATARKREARVPDEEEGMGESRAMSPQRDQLDPSSSCFPFQEIPSHPSDVHPFCSSPVRRASLLHAG